MIERTAAKAEMQERILQTTDRLFYEQGIRAVGVDTVAAEVGISKRTLYNYYPSKDELIRPIWRAASSRCRSPISRRPSRFWAISSGSSARSRTTGSAAARS